MRRSELEAQLEALREKNRNSVALLEKHRSLVPMESVDWHSKKVKATMHRMREVGQQALARARGKRERLTLEKFYSDEGLRERIRLMHDPAVLQMLEQIWVATDTDGSGAIERGEYLVMHRKLVLALDPTVPPKEAFEAARDDWVKDSAGLPALDKERFFWAWFELADLWTDTFSPAKYVGFLSSTLETVTHISPETGLIEWKSDADVLRSYFHKPAHMHFFFFFCGGRGPSIE